MTKCGILVGERSICAVCVCLCVCVYIDDKNDVGVTAMSGCRCGRQVIPGVPLPVVFQANVFF